MILKQIPSTFKHEEEMVSTRVSIGGPRSNDTNGGIQEFRREGSITEARDNTIQPIQEKIMSAQKDPCEEEIAEAKDETSASIITNSQDSLSLAAPMNTIVRKKHLLPYKFLATIKVGVPRMKDQALSQAMTSGKKSKLSAFSFTKKKAASSMLPIIEEHGNCFPKKPPLQKKIRNKVMTFLKKSAIHNAKKLIQTESAAIGISGKDDPDTTNELANGPTVESHEARYTEACPRDSSFVATMESHEARYDESSPRDSSLVAREGCSLQLDHETTTSNNCSTLSAFRDGCSLLQDTETTTSNNCSTLSVFTNLSNDEFSHFTTTMFQDDDTAIEQVLVKTNQRSLHISREIEVPYQARGDESSPRGDLFAPSDDSCVLKNNTRTSSNTSSTFSITLSNEELSFYSKTILREDHLAIEQVLVNDGLSFLYMDDAKEKSEHLRDDDSLSREDSISFQYDTTNSTNASSSSLHSHSFSDDDLSQHSKTTISDDDSCRHVKAPASEEMSNVWALIEDGDSVNGKASIKSTDSTLDGVAGPYFDGLDACLPQTASATVVAFCDYLLCGMLGVSSYTTTSKPTSAKKARNSGYIDSWNEEYLVLQKKKYFSADTITDGTEDVASHVSSLGNSNKNTINLPNHETKFRDVREANKAVQGENKCNALKRAIEVNRQRKRRMNRRFRGWNELRRVIEEKKRTAVFMESIYSSDSKCWNDTLDFVTKDMNDLGSTYVSESSVYSDMKPIPGRGCDSIKGTSNYEKLYRVGKDKIIADNPDSMPSADSNTDEIRLDVESNNTTPLAPKHAPRQFPKEMQSKPAGTNESLSNKDPVCCQMQHRAMTATKSPETSDATPSDKEKLRNMCRDVTAHVPSPLAYGLVPMSREHSGNVGPLAMASYETPPCNWKKVEHDIEKKESSDSKPSKPVSERVVKWVRLDDVADDATATGNTNIQESCEELKKTETQPRQVLNSLEKHDIYGEEKLVGKSAFESTFMKECQDSLLQAMDVRNSSNLPKLPEDAGGTSAQLTCSVAGPDSTVFYSPNVQAHAAEEALLSKITEPSLSPENTAKNSSLDSVEYDANKLVDTNVDSSGQPKEDKVFLPSGSDEIPNRNIRNGLEKVIRLIDESNEQTGKLVSNPFAGITIKDLSRDDSSEMSSILSDLFNGKAEAIALTDSDKKIYAVFFDKETLAGNEEFSRGDANRKQERKKKRFSAFRSKVWKVDRSHE